MDRRGRAGSVRGCRHRLTGIRRGLSPRSEAIAGDRRSNGDCARAEPDYPDAPALSRAARRPNYAAIAETADDCDGGRDAGDVTAETSAVKDLDVPRLDTDPGVSAETSPPPTFDMTAPPAVSSAWRRSASQNLPRSSRRYGSRRCEPTNPHRAAARTDRALCTMHQPRHLRCRQQRCVSLYRPSQCDTSVRKCPAVQREWRCPIERSPHHSASPDSRLLH